MPKKNGQLPRTVFPHFFRLGANAGQAHVGVLASRDSRSLIPFGIRFGSGQPAADISQRRKRRSCLCAARGELAFAQGFYICRTALLFRPPGYPLLLAAFMEVFGHHYITAVRFLQFIVGLLTVLICARTARHIFGREGQRATLIFGFYLPTLIFSTAQLMTECVSAFLTALFFLFLVEQQERGDGRSACGLGLIAGLESLMRFNAAILPFFALGAVIGGRRKGSVVLRSAAVLLLSALVVLPWMIRNASVFPGHVLYSTHTGANAVQGVVNTEGRTQPGDTEKLKAAMGWCVQRSR